MTIPMKDSKRVESQRSRLSYEVTHFDENIQLPAKNHKRMQARTCCMISDYEYIQSNIVISNMEKELQRNLRKDVKHIVNMQNLLQEYDRENKYLNKQVLDLMGENQRLRMDKVKVSIINDVLYSGKKIVKTPTKSNIINQFKQDSQKSAQNSNSKVEENSKKMDDSSKKMERSSSKKIIQKFKIESESAPIQVDIVKKDEAVQTPIFDKPVEYEKAHHQRQHNSENSKLNEDNAFSFRQATGKIQFQSQSASSKEYISQIDVKFGESSKQIQNNSSLSRIQGMSRQVIQQKLPQTQSNTIITQHQQTIKRESSQIEQFKRSHAIKPSPQVNTSLSKHKRYMTPSSSEKKLGNRDDSRTNIRPFESVQKKKRFIQIVSISHTPTKVPRGTGDDCC